MGYRIRILGKSLALVPLKELRQAALPAILEADEGVGDDWDALVLKHPGGDPITFIEKNVVVPGELGADEIEEFISEVAHYKPDSAATWLTGYLPGVKVIYSFQFLNGTETENGFNRLHSVYAAVWNVAGGILQADAEGFSNEQGNTILWQFSDEVSGPWNAAILTEEGNWINFEMDLGNRQQREAFQRGEVPKGVSIIILN